MAATRNQPARPVNGASLEQDDILLVDGLPLEQAHELGLIDDNDDVVSVVQAVVAHGRTTVDWTGKSVGPGQTAHVLEQDLERLTRLGFLVDPKAPAVLRRGPSSLSERL